MFRYIVAAAALLMTTAAQASDDCKETLIWCDGTYHPALTDYNKKVRPYYATDSVFDDFNDYRAVGYTGEGVDILVYDIFKNDGVDGDLRDGTPDLDPNSDNHGNSMAFIVSKLVPRADIYAESYQSWKGQAIGPGETWSSPDSNSKRFVEKFTKREYDVVNMSMQAGDVTYSFFLDFYKSGHKVPVTVFSAGNDSSKCENGCNDLADSFLDLEFVDYGVALDGTIEKFAESTIIALALEEDGKKLASYSNHAGKYKDSALAVPVYPYGGTSSAAPVISAAAAMVKQRFGNVSSSQIVEILLTTADDLGDEGVDSKYGNGRLNLSRALSPNSRLH